MAKNQEKNEKKNKRPVIARWLWYLLLLLAVVLLFCSIFFTGRWGLNTLYVAEAKRGVYHPIIEGFLSIINVPEGYKIRYNLGNYHFAKGQYKKAEEDYHKALMHLIPYEKECPVKVNLALSMINQLSDDEWESFLAAESADDMDAKARHVEETLQTARSVLIEDGCAHADDDEGHDEQAQILKDEIDELLKKSGGQGGDEDNDQGGSDNSQDENDEGGGGSQGGSSSREDQVKEHIQQQKEKNQQERTEERQDLETYGGMGQEDDGEGGGSGEGDGGSGAGWDKW